MNKTCLEVYNFTFSLKQQPNAQPQSHFKQEGQSPNDSHVCTFNKFIFHTNVRRYVDMSPLNLVIVNGFPSLLLLIMPKLHAKGANIHFWIDSN
jgi:hypothetical protein